MIIKIGGMPPFSFGSVGEEGRKRRGEQGFSFCMDQGGGAGGGQHRRRERWRGESVALKVLHSDHAWFEKGQQMDVGQRLGLFLNRVPYWQPRLAIRNQHLKLRLAVGWHGPVDLARVESYSDISSGTLSTR